MHFIGVSPNKRTSAEPLEDDRVLNTLIESRRPLGGGLRSFVPLKHMLLDGRVDISGGVLLKSPE